jgi:hypothetical protein
MAVSLASQITREGMVVVSAFKRLLIEELAHYRLHLIDVFAPLRHQSVMQVIGQYVHCGQPANLFTRYL